MMISCDSPITLGVYPVEIIASSCMCIDTHTRTYIYIHIHFITVKQNYRNKINVHQYERWHNNIQLKSRRQSFTY